MNNFTNTANGEKYDITDYWCESCYWYPELVPGLFTNITASKDDALVAPCPKCEALNEITLTRKLNLEEDRPFQSLFDAMGDAMKQILQAVRNTELNNCWENLTYSPNIKFICCSNKTIDPCPHHNKRQFNGWYHYDD